MISYKPLVLGMLDSTACTLHTFTSVELVMLMIVQSSELVCHCVFFVYQMIIHKSGEGNLLFSKKKKLY